MKKNQKTKWIVAVAVVATLVVAVMLSLNKRGQTDIVVDDSIPRLRVTSPAFEDLGRIPDKHTGRGEDLSPALAFADLAEGAVSIAIIMDDLDIPWKSNFTHWVIWNLPAMDGIPEGVSPGETVAELGGAVQGIAYGRNRYRGPMPPFGTHRYQFHVFVLDATLELNSACRKVDLLGAMQGHIMQYGTLTGWYPREDK